MNNLSLRSLIFTQLLYAYFTILKILKIEKQDMFIYSKAAIKFNSQSEECLSHRYHRESEVQNI